MKILIATGIYPPEIGGPATYAKLLHDRLPSYGFTTDILPFREVRQWPKIIRHLVYLFKILRRGREADLIFTQDPVSTGLPSIIGGKMLGKKVIIRVAGDYAWEQGRSRFGVVAGIDEFQHNKYAWRVNLLKKIQSYSVGVADQVITPSKYFARLVSGWNSRAKVMCIYNGIELPANKPETRRDRKLLFSAGRLVNWKGFDVLIELMRDLPPDWRLFIAGDGPDRKKLESMINSFNLKDRVKLLGLISREQILEYLSRAGIFVLNTSFESFSFQVVEAMWAEVPVIATNVGNLAEIITDGEEGLLVSPNNQEQILGAILALDSDDELRERIIKKAKLKASQFSVDLTLKNLGSLLARL